MILPVCHVPTHTSVYQKTIKYWLIRQLARKSIMIKRSCWGCKIDYWSIFLQSTELHIMILVGNLVQPFTNENRMFPFLWCNRPRLGIQLGKGAELFPFSFFSFFFLLRERKGGRDTRILVSKTRFLGCTSQELNLKPLNAKQTGMQQPGKAPAHRNSLFIRWFKPRVEPANHLKTSFNSGTLIE